jgi:hypothetical protein
MIIVRLTGGLGNQLFQYAAGRRLALAHGTELLLDVSSYGEHGEKRPEELADFPRHFKLFEFMVAARIATQREIAKLRDNFYRATVRDRLVRLARRFLPSLLWPHSHIVEREYRFQKDVLGLPDNVFLQGYWQSPKYFEDIAATIRQDFQPRDGALKKSAIAKVDELRQQHGRVVSLHMRRGDLARAQALTRARPLTHAFPVSTSYVERALLKFEPEDCFFVFSDTAHDIAWCRDNLRAKHIELSTASSDLWDFFAMNACDDHIIANSTFSWWAAWLNDKPGRKVVAPRQWASPQAGIEMTTDDLLPAGWMVL